MSELTRWFTYLIEALRILASSPKQQLAHLASIGDIEAIDELALEFDDAFRGLDQFVRAGLLNNRQAAAVQELDARLGAMSGLANSYLWTGQALETAQEWCAVREYAARCLAALGQA